jgi:predicted negative regulator of RcsB-dependent stress response
MFETPYFSFVAHTNSLAVYKPIWAIFIIMLSRRISLLFCLVFGLAGNITAQLDSLLDVLDAELGKRASYLAEKELALLQFDQLRSQTNAPEEQFEITLEKVRALESFSFTRAFGEVLRLKELARQLDDPVKINQAKIREAFIFLSAGLFNEALDSLNTINIDSFSSELRTDYYTTRARTHFDLSENYAINSLSDKFRDLGLRDLDSAIVYTQSAPLARLSLLGNKELKLDHPSEGLKYYHQVRTHPGASTRLMAKEHGAAGILFNMVGMKDSARLAIVKSAIADERTVTREAISLVRVARYVYEMEDYERSAHYIKVGLENANFFDARHRKMEVLDILPLIEEERQQLLRAQRRQFVIFTVLLSLLLFLALWLIRHTILQNRELRDRRQALLDAYQQLRDNNNALRESERIKEQYIGHFFQTNTKFITGAKKVIDKAAKAIYAADFKEAKYQLKSFNAKQQNKQLLQDFDEVFLTLFPDFVRKFQALFPPETIWQAEAQDELSSEVRIFALMRLGIKNNNTISKILGYSVNTIYAYRSKIRGKSLLDNDAFDQAVMEISSTDPA